MTIRISAALLGAASVAAPAVAVAQERPSTFTGPRIEARIGWDRPTIRGTVSDGTDSISDSAGKDGAVYGGEIGYDRDLGGVLVGAYAGVAGSSVRSCGELYGDDELCLRSGRDITAGARVGFVASPGFLLYGKAGYANGRLRVTYQDFENILADQDEGTNFGGFHAGAGLEATLNGGVYGRLEYVYTDYSGRSVALDGARFTADLRRHQVAFGLGYRF